MQTYGPGALAIHDVHYFLAELKRRLDLSDTADNETTGADKVIALIRRCTRYVLIMNTNVALITGAYGQDGVYLTDFLVHKGYPAIYGIVRNKRIDSGVSKSQVHYIQGDVLDFDFVVKTLKHIIHSHEFEKLEIYNLAAISSVKMSFEIPISCADINAFGPLKMLEAIKQLSDIDADKVRFYQASSSEMFGVSCGPLNEQSSFNPVSPYGIAKTFAHHIVKCYRHSYGIFACSGILFNHESPRRGIEFVTRKITTSLLKILSGEIECLEVGNLDSKRDWGHASDFVVGMWLMLQAETPNDYVLATGEFHSVREFIVQSFAIMGIALRWNGSGVNEVGVSQGRTLVRINPAFYRPIESTCHIGDSSRASTDLGWYPIKTFHDLVTEMVQEDCKQLSLEG